MATTAQLRPAMRWVDRITVAISPSMFSGITLRKWKRVLQDNHFAVDRAYWPRAATISLVSLGNSVLGTCENLLYCKKIRDTQIPPPLFILGAWRSGTTLLFNLLTTDRRFAFLNAYEAAFPHTFLLTERIVAGLSGHFMPKKRPQDNMAFGAREPQEDEFAMCSLLGRTFLLSLAFPRTASFYDRWLTLKDVSEEERLEWQSALRDFVQKLTFKHGRPLVLKSPGHTGRIRLLLDLFPNAKFVHIRRDPFVVFQSARHTVRKVTPWVSLQTSDFGDLEERTIRQYKELYRAYFDERSLIPSGHLHEICFEDLERDAIGQMRRAYECLELPDFAEVEPVLCAYVNSLSGYRKNEFCELTATERARIAHEWRFCFEAWEYPLD